MTVGKIIYRVRAYCHGKTGYSYLQGGRETLKDPLMATLWTGYVALSVSEWEFLDRQSLGWKRGRFRV